MTAEELIHAEESVEWAIRALADCIVRGINIATDEAVTIAKLFADVDALPEEKKAVWLSKIAEAGIVRA